MLSASWMVLFALCTLLALATEEKKPSKRLTATSSAEGCGGAVGVVGAVSTGAGWGAASTTFFLLLQAPMASKQNKAKVSNLLRGNLKFPVFIVNLSI